MTTQQLTSEALALPAEDRVSIAQALWQILAQAEVIEEDDEMLSVAMRRGAELDSGAVKGRSREEAMHAARQALK